MSIFNRLKKGESTLCTYSECGSEIKEGDVLGYGDNHPCLVLYNKFEGRFDAVEFGYVQEEDVYRTHELIAYTVKWRILGSVENGFSLLKDVPLNFDYSEHLQEYYD